MEPIKHDFKYKELPGLEERRKELSNTLETWRYRLDVFTNPHLADTLSDKKMLVDLKNPLEFKAYEKAVFLERGLKMTTELSFSPSLFGQGLQPFKPSLAKLLASQGPLCKMGVIAAASIFAASNMKGNNIIERGQELTGFVADARAKISNVMDIQGVVTTIDEVGTAKYNLLREKVAQKADLAFEQLGNALTADQKAMMKDWMTWGDAKVLQNVSKAMEAFQGQNLVGQSVVLLNTLNTFYPTLDIATRNQLMDPSLRYIREWMNKAVSVFIDAQKKASAAEVAKYSEHDSWVNSAAASAINMINYGVTIENGVKLPVPARAVGVVIVTEMARQIAKLEQSSIEGKYQDWV